MSGPYYVAMHGGMLVAEDYPGLHDQLVRKVYTQPDPRVATPFNTFDQADACAKYAVNKLYPPDLRYFAIYQNAQG